MKTLSIARVALLVVAAGLADFGRQALGADAGLKTEEQKLGYAIGMKIGGSLKEQKIAPDADYLGKAVTATLTGSPPLMTTEQIRAVLSSLPVGPKVVPPGDPNFKDTKQEVGYALGMYFGRMVANDDTNTDVPSLVLAVKDTLAGAKTLLTTNEMQEILTAHQQKQAAVMKVEGEKNLKLGQDFLDKNKSAPEVKVLPSGLQFKVLTTGTGPMPKLTDTVKVNYRGTLIDGTEFDASKPGEPITFPLNHVIHGWTEILQLMPTGSKWKVFIPASLAYGEQSPTPKIPSESVLIFDIELLDIEPPAAMPGLLK